MSLVEGRGIGDPLAALFHREGINEEVRWADQPLLHSGRRLDGQQFGLCRKFCSGGHERTVVPVGGGLRGQSVELFGRSEAFVSGPD